MRNKWPLFGACFLNLAIGSALPRPVPIVRHAPVEVISNVGQLAQTLHDRIIGDLLTDYPWEIGQILSAPIDRAIFKDGAGAADADDGGQLDLVLSAPLEKFLQLQALDGAFTVRSLDQLISFCLVLRSACRLADPRPPP